MPSSASSQRFDKIATNFATSEVHAMSPTIQQLHKLLGEQIFDAVCDVACGTGHLALSFANRARRIVGIDPSSNMLEAFQMLASQKGVVIEATKALSENLPYPDNSFDVVMSRLAPHHFSDIERAVSEIVRVAKPGGVVAVIDLEGDPNAEIDDFNHALEVLHDPTHFRSYTAARWRTFFERSGLAVESQETKLSERPSGVSVKRWCEIASSGAEAEAAIRDRLRSASPQYITALGIRRDGDEFFMPIRTTLILGRKP
jgi:ubiquinone/menaquinone biosynthesis C-methylase UbiE